MLDNTTHTPSPLDLGPRVPLFTLKGSRPGPRLVVTGPKTLLRDIADMFWDRRERAAIHGALVLRIEGQDTTLDLPDETLALEPHELDAERAFDSVFDQMVTLGMIPTEICTAA